MLIHSMLIYKQILCLDCCGKPFFIFVVEKIMLLFHMMQNLQGTK